LNQNRIKLNLSSQFESILIIFLNFVHSPYKQKKNIIADNIAFDNVRDRRCWSRKCPSKSNFKKSL